MKMSEMISKHKPKKKLSKENKVDYDNDKSGGSIAGIGKKSSSKGNSVIYS